MAVGLIFVHIYASDELESKALLCGIESVKTLLSRVT